METKANPFSDLALVVILLVNQLIIYLVEKMALYLRRRFKIWEVKKNLPQAQKLEASDSLEKDEALQLMQNPFIKYKVKLELTELNEIEESLAEDERIRRCLETLEIDKWQEEKLQMFLKLNRKWITDNMKTILSPNTLLKSRNKLHHQLCLVNPNPISYRPHRSIIESRPKLREVDLFSKEQIQASLSFSFQQILKTWLERSRHIKLIRSQVAGILELLTEPYCESCGSNWGLKCESIANIEDIFEKFKTSPGFDKKTHKWKVVSWQKFFIQNCIFRTYCYICYESIIPKNN